VSFEHGSTLAVFLNLPRAGHPGAAQPQVATADAGKQ